MRGTLYNLEKAYLGLENEQGEAVSGVEGWAILRRARGSTVIRIMFVCHVYS